jgi:hypothetical protein
MLDEILVLVKSLVFRDGLMSKVVPFPLGVCTLAVKLPGIYMPPSRVPLWKGYVHVSVVALYVAGFTQVALLPVAEKLPLLSAKADAATKTKTRVVTTMSKRFIFFLRLTKFPK